MTFTRTILLALASTALGACSSPAATAPASPLSSAPLSGSIGGKPFAAQGSFSEPLGSSMSFLVFDAHADCTPPRSLAHGDSYVGMTLPWPLTAGMAWTFQDNDGQVELTDVVEQGQRTASTNGRIEIVSVTPKTLTVRLRAAVTGDQTSMTTGSIEGQIDLNVCGD